ncbi:MAG: hypothetical protein MZV64_22990 [Ignavibacteriales bacterium]|nr:hypothetical protein [Ignavibacteriales bacterium]
MFSAVFGILGTLAIVALIDPFAGGLMAIQALVVKYTSQAYLEAIPLACMILSVFAFAQNGQRKSAGAWFWLSAFALGVVTAGKFTYTPVLVVLLAYLAFICERGVPFRWMAGFGASSPSRPSSC